MQDEHALKLEKLVADREAVGNHLDTIRATTDSKRENISKMAAQTLAIREKGSEYTLSSQISDSRTAYALSLYAKISNITWDYEAPTGKIAGCEYIFFITIYQNSTNLIITITNMLQALEMTKRRLSNLSVLTPAQKHLLRQQILCGILLERDSRQRNERKLFHFGQDMRNV